MNVGIDKENEQRTTDDDKDGEGNNDDRKGFRARSHGYRPSGSGLVSLGCSGSGDLGLMKTRNLLRT